MSAESVRSVCAIFAILFVGVIVLRRNKEGDRNGNLVEYALMAGFVVVAAGAIMPGLANLVARATGGKPQEIVQASVVNSTSPPDPLLGGMVKSLKRGNLIRLGATIYFVLAEQDDNVSMIRCVDCPVERWTTQSILQNIHWPNDVIRFPDEHWNGAIGTWAYQRQ